MQWNVTQTVQALTNITHTVSVQVSGKKNVLSSGYSVSVDGIKVGKIYLDDANPAVKFGTWAGKVDAREASQGMTLNSAKFAKEGDAFHIVTGPVPFNADGPIRAHWDAVYKHLTSHGFSAKPVMEGVGGAAGEVYNWAIANPDKVSCIYAENPILRSSMSKTQPLDNLAPLAKAGIPLLHVCGNLDPSLDTQTRVAEKRYKELGGPMIVILKPGEGHYPLAPKDPKPVVDFITASAH